MSRMLGFIICMWPLYSTAANTLPFKTELVTHHSWYSYGFILAGLLSILIILAKMTQSKIKHSTNGKVLDHFPIHHKTKAYVVDYQGQRFLIAEHQNALAIHPLQKDTHIS